MRTILGGLLVLIIVTAAAAVPPFVVMHGLGSIHDLYPEVPALDFYTILWGFIIVSLVGAAWNQSNFWSDHK